MDDAAKSKEKELISDLRALMIANQGGLPIHNLKRKYFRVTG